MTRPCVVEATVTHRRTRPIAYGFSHRTTTWLVDAADPNAAFPRWLRPWLRIDPRDHLGPEEADLLTKVRTQLRAEGVDWSAASVTVLVNARTAGHVFDPLTTYFVHDNEGAVEGILAEVHNTYGGRHCYALPATTMTTGSGVDKAFYVSPFFAVEGRYDVRARLTTDRVAVSIRLTQGDEEVFVGAVDGPLRPATPRAVARAVARDPFAPQRVSLLIRLHGIRLWLRRLPVVPRNPRTATRGMA